MKQPRITVITPNLNNDQFLERTICSVLDQGYDNLEYFVIDGGSEDDSLEILGLYENDLAGWLSEPDRSAAQAINKGLARATGDIVAILSSDDLYLPGTLETVARRFTCVDNPLWLVGQCVRIGADDRMLGHLSPNEPESFASFLMHDSGVLPPASSFWRRGLIETYGKLDATLSMAYDYEFDCRLMASGERPTIIADTLSARREHPMSKSAVQTVRRGLECIDTARRYADRLPLSLRYPLWLNCDQRERIYALAQAEVQGDHGREFLWQQLLRHPWWVVDQTLRHCLVHGVTHPLPDRLARPAA